MAISLNRKEVENGPISFWHGFYYLVHLFRVYDVLGARQADIADQQFLIFLKNECLLAFQKPDRLVDKNRVDPFLETPISPVFKLANTPEYAGERNRQHILSVVEIGKVPHSHMKAASVKPVEQVPLTIWIISDTACYDVGILQMIVWFSKMGTRKFTETLPGKKLCTVKEC